MDASKLLLCIFFIPTVTCIDSSNILLMPLPWMSHVMELQHIGQELVKHGHTVYMVLPDHYPGMKKIIENSQIKVIGYTAKYKDFLLQKNSDEFFDLLLEITMVQKFREYDDGMIQICHNVLQSDRLEKDIVNAKIDLAVIDAFPFTRCYYVLAYKLGLQYVSLSTTYEPWLYRTPALPSFVPFPLNEPPSSPKMTFYQRLINSWALLDWTAHTHHISTISDTLVTKYAPTTPFISIDELASRSLLWLYNTDVVLDYPRPMMPNEINIGGLSTHPAKTLSTDIQAFVEKAPQGTVLISFGSHSVIPERYALKMLDAFKKLPKGFHFLFRYPFSRPNNLPSNVMLLDWVPQNDILGHNNTKLFVTHCGANGQFEALYHGVPMLGFPSFADQPYNAKRSDFHGFGLSLDIKSFTVEQLHDAVLEILQVSKYHVDIQKAASIFRSRKRNPRERAAYWIEHVLTHGGAHLRSHALDMPWYQYLMLDILLLTFAGFIFFVVLLSLCCLYCYTLISKNGKHKSD